MSAGTWRRPLTSTSVRWVPRPRRSSRLRPAMPMPAPGLAWLKVLRSWGSSLSSSPMLVDEFCRKSSPAIEVIGTVDSRLGRRMREPVTTIEPPDEPPSALATSSHVPSASLSMQAVCGSACAKAGVAMAAMARTPGAAASRRSEVVFTMSVPVLAGECSLPRSMRSLAVPGGCDRPDPRMARAVGGFWPGIGPPDVAETGRNRKALDSVAGDSRPRCCAYVTSRRRHGRGVENRREIGGRAVMHFHYTRCNDPDI